MSPRQSAGPEEGICVSIAGRLGGALLALRFGDYLSCAFAAANRPIYRYLRRLFMSCFPVDDGRTEFSSVFGHWKLKGVPYIC